MNGENTQGDQVQEAVEISQAQPTVVLDQTQNQVITETQQTNIVERDASGQVISTPAGTRSYDFSLSMLLFWIKGNISVDSRVVKIRTANTILGIFPAGLNDQSIPVANISAASIHTNYQFLGLVLGAIIVLVGFGMISQSFATAIVVMLFGILVFGGGMQTVLRIQRAGSDYLVSVPFYEKSKLLEAKDAIDEALIAKAEQGDLGLYFERR